MADGEEEQRPTDVALLSTFWQLLRSGALTPLATVFTREGGGIRIEWECKDACALVVNGDGTGYVYTEWLPECSAEPLEKESLRHELWKRGLRQ